VPFGEYVPFGPLLSWVDKAVATIGEFGRGRERVVFDGPVDSSGEHARYSVLICYEGIFPALTRSFVAAGAELLLNISNDAWYGRTSAPYQHMAMAAVRAVENRVPLVRSTNSGISAVVDRSGRIRAQTSLFEEVAFTEVVDIGRGGSLYAVVGDAFVILCLVLLVVLALLRRLNGAPNVRNAH
jgi:apolipoprotein N-acyltransferase